MLGSAAEMWREEGARAGVIAVISTVVFFGGAIVLVANSPNWPRVRDQFFNGDDFRESWPDVVDGFWLNIELFVYAMLLIPVVALLIAVMRSLRGPAFFPIRLLSVVFTDVFRGIPLILASSKTSAEIAGEIGELVAAQPADGRAEHGDHAALANSGPAFARAVTA